MTRGAGRLAPRSFRDWGLMARKKKEEEAAETVEEASEQERPVNRIAGHSYYADGTPVDPDAELLPHPEPL